MKYRMFVYGIVAVTITFGCSPRSRNSEEENCHSTLAKLLKKDGDRLQVNSKENNIITQLVDKTSDPVTAGAYYFYPNGTLKSYKFFASDKKYQYNEEYDSLGKITLVEGSPLLLHGFRQIDTSGVRFTFFFFGLHQEYKDIEVKTNTGIHFRTELSPNAVFTNVKSTTFDLPVAKFFRDVKIYVECQLIDVCLNKEWTLRDTATFDNMSLK